MRIFQVFLIILCGFIFGAYYATQSLKPAETVITNSCTVQKSVTKEITIKPAIKRTRKIAQLRFHLKGEWTEEDTKIRYADGNVISLDISLETQSGEKVSTEIYHKLDNTFIANFSHIPNGKLITKIIIESTETITFEKVSWYYFNVL